MMNTSKAYHEVEQRCRCFHRQLKVHKGPVYQLKYDHRVYGLGTQGGVLCVCVCPNPDIQSHPAFPIRRKKKRLVYRLLGIQATKNEIEVSFLLIPRLLRAQFWVRISFVHQGFHDASSLATTPRNIYSNAFCICIMHYYCTPCVSFLFFFNLITEWTFLAFGLEAFPPPFFLPRFFLPFFGIFLWEHRRCDGVHQVHQIYTLFAS